MMSKSTNPNPWLLVPAEDYEGHMGSEQVGQLSVLNGIFRDAMDEFDPRRVALLGCTLGNGLEHVDPDITRQVTCVDINPEYLTILRNRFVRKIRGLDLLCEDLAHCELGRKSYDLIHGALIFEYLDPVALLSRISGWLAPAGYLVIVLQLPSPSQHPVSETPFTSVRVLEPCINLVSPDLLLEAAPKCDLTLIERREIPLKQGKKFEVLTFQKP